jgi:hypothetical protein
MFYGLYSPHSLMEATVQTLDMGRTTIQVSDELADELHSRKERGDSYEDVVWQLIEESNGESQRPQQEPSSPDPRTGENDGERGIEATLTAVEFPSSRDREDCVQAVRAAYEYLQREGSGTMRDFVRDVMPEHPVGYDVPDLKPGERYRGAWWRKVVKPGLEALPDVESPSRGASDWTISG